MAQLIAPIHTFPDFNPKNIIHILEEGIQAEKALRAAYKLLGQDVDYMASDLRITHAETFLSFLRLNT